MNFTGTQQKCKACGKTVYPVELLSADGIDYHKSCFKCSHCKGTLKLSNKRRVTLTELKGKGLVCIKEYYRMAKSFLVLKVSVWLRSNGQTSARMYLQSRRPSRKWKQSV